MRVEQMEQIINYRDIPTDKRIDILNALERIGFSGIRRRENNAANSWKSQFQVQAHNSISFSVKMSW